MKRIWLITRGAVTLLGAFLLGSIANKSIMPVVMAQGGYDRADYKVKMNDDGSQHIWLNFHVSADGKIHVHARLTNDVYNQGFCGSYTLKLSDKRDDRTLFQGDSPEACVNGKGYDTNFHERTAYADWDTSMDPELAKQFLANPSEWAGKKSYRNYIS